MILIMKNNKKRRGFTLIELLVVIAIIAILAVVVVLTLNPAELLRQARDSNRLSDFATMKSALGLYAQDVVTTTPMFGTAGYDLFTANVSATNTMSLYAATAPAPGWGFVGGEIALITTSSQAIGGTGWVPVNLNAITSGAPISAWPVDPVNKGDNMYIYAATSTLFKLATQMESAKYSPGGSGNVVTGDGGTSIYSYQQGSDLLTL
jgi:prepilin-type N-terminal cleavage/methylation domain-containing protein